MSLLTRKGRLKGEEARPRARALLAAAMPLEGPAGRQAWNAASGDTQWQKSAWYYYDAIGELRFAHNWLASAVSRATLYAAEVDPETGLITGPTEDPRAQAAVAAVLGGVDDRPQLMSTVSLQWQVAGESYILIVPQGAGIPDRWMSLSRRALQQRGGEWSFEDPLTGVMTKLRPGRDKLIRIWSPHPDKQTSADSAMRAAIPICAEIEKASQNIAARLDSRLAGNGIMFIPQEIDFPTAEGEPADAQAFMKLLMEASEASISNPGTAAAQVPIMAQVPGELLSALADAHVDLSTDLDGAVTEIRSQGINRLGSTLDMAKEIALGQMADANHWSGWQIEEGTFKIHVEPFLLKFGMALTSQYFRPALQLMGETNPDRFVLAWDVTEIVSRPDDREDVKYLLESNLVSEDWVRGKFGVPDDAIPSGEESRRNLARVLASAAPTILENASIAEALGFEPTAQPEPVAPSITSGEDEAAPEGVSRGLPTRQAQPPEPDEGLVAAAELVVFDALSRAGGRLLTRQYRGQFASTPKHELHTVIPHQADDTPRLLEGSFQFTANISHAFGREPRELDAQIKAYVQDRLIHGRVHDRETLRRFL